VEQLGSPIRFRCPHAIRRHYELNKPEAVPTDDALDAMLDGAYDAMDA